MRTKKLWAITLVVAMMITSLAGCAKNKDTSSDSTTPAPTSAVDGTDETDETEAAVTPAVVATEVAAQFPSAVTNDNASIEGGILKVALVTDSAFAGVLNPCFYEDAYDSEILQWFTENILSFDDNFVADQEGPATYEFDAAAKTVTLHMKEGIKWQDGVPVTLDDLVFAFEVICNKDYEGFRYSENEMNVVGVIEYHDGTADSISGLALSEDKMTLTITFKDFYPSILVGGFWSSAIPRHYYEGIPIKDMAADDKTRVTPLGFGPFKVKNIVPGESVEFERYDDYWLGTPKLDGVIVTVINPDLVPTAMQEGQYDIATFSTQQYPDYKEPTNYTYLGEVQTVFSYTGFKLGKWNQEKVENIVDPTSKMFNLNLRQAIGYAVDNATLCESFYNGLRFPATTVITPRHATYQNKDLVGYTYDPEKAKQLLEEAGYKDVDGDGFREDPNGQPLVISWATMEGENAETYAQFKIQCWNEVGLNVELFNGRLTEFNAFYEAVEADDPGIDMFDGAWNTGFDPNPDALWGHLSAANYTRYTSDTFDAITDVIASDKAWDNVLLNQKYQEWQQAFFDEAPAIPTLWRIALYAVNNRVKNYDTTSVDIKAAAHLIELTAADPIK